MRRHGMRVCVLAVLCALLCIAGAHTAATATTPFYGKLSLPVDYFQHPDSEDRLNRVQPGSVLLASRDHTLRIPVQKDGAFVAYHVPYGTYILQADYHDFTFPTVRVSVQYKEVKAAAGAAATTTVHVPVIRCTSVDYPEEALHGSGLDEESPVYIPAVAVHRYYVPREEFSLTALVKNPMVLMLLVSGALMLLMRIMPEEDRKEAEKMNREWGKKLVKRAAEMKESGGGVGAIAAAAAGTGGSAAGTTSKQQQQRQTRRS